MTKKLDISHPFSSVLEQIKELPDLEKLQKLEEKADTTAARDILFAVWDGDECIPDRETISMELAAIPGFDDLSINAKLDHLLQIAEANPSPKALAYLVAVALNLVANALGSQFSNVIWGLIFLVVLADYFWPKERVRTTRKLLRAAHVADSNSRVVKYACKVCAAPKSKVRQIGWLDAAAVVVVADSFGGWRQVYFVDVESEETRLGWVRSKYLARI